MNLHRAVVAGSLALSAATLSATTAPSVRTPFETVPLWSQEMLEYLTGEKQAACSGDKAAQCERVNAGLCDGTADFTFHQDTTNPATAAFHPPDKQTNAAKPQMFKLRLDAEHSHATDVYSYASGVPDSMKVVFDCQFSGNDACAGRFQIGNVNRIELSTLSGAKQADLTRVAKVLPDGPIMIPIDAALKRSVIDDATAMYHVRVVAECFTILSPVEWTLPVYTAPSAAAETAGAVIVRVTPGTHIEFLYRANNGATETFVPDWADEDWGYIFLMDQTFLDRKDDWFQLPRRPFPAPVWIHLPDRQPGLEMLGASKSSPLPENHVYTLSKAVTAHRQGASGTARLPAGNYTLVASHARMLEIRKEEAFDSPCYAGAPPRPKGLRTYLVKAEEFYDSDLHLALQLAYPRGC